MGRNYQALGNRLSAKLLHSFFQVQVDGGTAPCGPVNNRHVLAARQVRCPGPAPVVSQQRHRQALFRKG